VELNGALSNPLASDKSLPNRLTELREALLQKAAGNPRQPAPAPRRPTPVLETVTLVLALAGEPMRAREIHAASETLTSRQLHWSSVKASLAAGATGRSPRFERLCRGMYRLAQHTPEADNRWD
jgi:hypothetical protein